VERGRHRVVQRTSKDHANDATALRDRGRAEKGIDCRAGAVLMGASCDPHGSLLKQEAFLRTRVGLESSLDGGGLQLGWRADRVGASSRSLSTGRGHVRELGRRWWSVYSGRLVKCSESGPALRREEMTKDLELPGFC
jgi:hypothetical protein